jgi:protein transport protein DSL1/ZW10
MSTGAVVNELIVTDFSEHENELGPGPHKIVRQCLLKLDLLKNVWQMILPTIVYNKSTGTLLNDFCVEIIRRICNLEDISSDMATGFSDIIGTILDKAPSIFEVS